MTGTTFGYPMAFRLSQGMGQQEILRKTFRKVLDNLQKSLGKVAEILRITDRKVLDFCTRAYARMRDDCETQKTSRLSYLSYTDVEKLSRAG